MGVFNKIAKDVLRQAYVLFNASTLKKKFHLICYVTRYFSRFFLYPWIIVSKYKHLDVDYFAPLGDDWNIWGGTKKIIFQISKRERKEKTNFEHSRVRNMWTMNEQRVKKLLRGQFDIFHRRVIFVGTRFIQDYFHLAYMKMIFAWGISLGLYLFIFHREIAYMSRTLSSITVC